MKYLAGFILGAVVGAFAAMTSEQVRAALADARAANGPGDARHHP